MKVELKNVKRKQYDFPDVVTIPDDCKKKLFIPGFGTKCMHYYYLLDFKTQKITHWILDLTEMKNQLKENLTLEPEIEKLPWNHQDLDQYLEAVIYAHSAEYHDNKIYVFNSFINFFICVDLDTLKCEIIYDEKNKTKVLSATNQILDGEIYMTRWDVNDSFKREFNQDHKVNIEIIKYNIHEDRFTIIDNYTGIDEVHTTSISPDKKNLLILSMCKYPNKSFPTDVEDADVELMREILDSELRDSYITTYNFDTGSTHQVKIKGGPAHLEFDLNNLDIYYTIGNNISFSRNSVYCHGQSSIYKMKIDENNQSQIVGYYTDNDFYRGTAHKLLKYKGKQYMPYVVYPQRIHILNPETMDKVDEIVLSKTERKVDFSQGPFKFAPAIFDKTPFCIQVEDNTSYIYGSNVWNVSICDISTSKRISKIVYNNGSDMVAIGHTCKFEK